MLGFRNGFVVLGILFVILFGYNIIVLSIYIIGVFFASSTKSLMYSLSKQIILLITFVLAFSFGLINFSNLTYVPTSDDVRIWVGFFAIYLLSLSLLDKEGVLLRICSIINFLFFLDLATNILLLCGVSVPWAQIPMVRPGENLPRFPGVKNSALFSGYISMLYFNILLYKYEKFSRHILLQYIGLFLNVILAGSYRFFVILLFLFITKKYKLYKRIGTYFALMIGSVVTFSILTMKISGSNFIRVKLWRTAICKVLDADNFIGIGFFVPKVPEGATGYMKLQLAGVTESTILQWGVCYGYIVLLLLLFGLICILLKVGKYRSYTLEMGFFIIEFSLWCFGGGIGNILNITLLALSISLILDHDINNSTNIQ